MKNFWQRLKESLVDAISLLSITILSALVLSMFMYAIITILGGAN